jgi:hypothetical protein
VPVVPQRGTVKHLLFRTVRSWLAGKDMEVIRHVPFDPQVRAEGRDWPAQAESMAGLLDERVRFLVGWFKDTLPSAPIQRLAVLRLDGDMYGSTMEALQALYPKLSVGGYVIVDDYGAIPQCKEAVTDFREAHGISDPMEWVDWTGVWWQRSGEER